MFLAVFCTRTTRIQEPVSRLRVRACASACASACECARVCSRVFACVRVCVLVRARMRACARVRVRACARMRACTLERARLTCATWRANRGRSVLKARVGLRHAWEWLRTATAYYAPWDCLDPPGPSGTSARDTAVRQKAFVGTRPALRRPQKRSSIASPAKCARITLRARCSLDFVAGNFRSSCLDISPRLMPSMSRMSSISL